MEEQQLAVHRTIVVVDVEGFGDRRRTNRHQVAVRAGLYRSLREAFHQAGIPWVPSACEDRGDGALVLIPAEVPKALLVELLPSALARELHAHNGAHPGQERIRLRMALHAGEVTYDEHGVTAASVNLAFRLAEAEALKTALAESPGVLAVIVSSWFFEEVVRHSATGDAAKYRSVPVRVKETVTTGWICLPDHPYPPVPPMLERPSAARTTGGQEPMAALRMLPRDTALFTGRARELEHLVAAVSEAAAAGWAMGIHAVNGMAGIGKTTFAVHAAHLLAPRFPDGQYFLPLHSHTPGQRPADPGTALETLLLATGIATSRVPDGVDARAMLWRNGVASKKILLVLDDAASHEQVRPLLPGTPGSLVLITSRRRLAALEEATPISLGTLPPPDAAMLFARLAGRADSDAAAVADITRLCGYLPLAIRLIAGTLRHRPPWSITDLAAELAAGKGRLAAMRAENLSVAAAFDLSYQDLAPDQQRLFRRLGLHPGTSIDAYAAAALDDTTLDATRRHLDDLYDHHLITEPARGRYRLHDLLREHARGLAARDSTGRDAAVGRLLDYYLHTAAAARRLTARRPPPGIPPIARPPAHTPPLSAQDEALAWFEAERANLDACTQYAAARALHVHAVWIPAQLSEFLATRGYWDQAFTLHRIAETAAQAAGDQGGYAAALTHLGTVQYVAGDYPAAITSLSGALSLYRDLGDRPGTAVALTHLGRVQLHTDSYPSAAASLSEALRLHRDLRDPLGHADALASLGSLQTATGDYPAAAVSLSNSLVSYHDLGDRQGQAYVLIDYGTVQCDTGDHQAAVSSLTQAVALNRELADRYGEIRALVHLGEVQRLTGNCTAAAISLTRALDLSRETSQRHGYAHALLQLGTVQHITGDLATAATSLRQALELCRDIGEKKGQATALNHLGALLSDSSGHENGLACHTEALTLARDIGSPREEADALQGIGQRYIQAGNTSAGRTYLRQALEIYQRLGSPSAQLVENVLNEPEPCNRQGTQ